MNPVDKTFYELKNEQEKIKLAIHILRKHRARICQLYNSERIVISMVPEKSTKFI